MPQLDKEESENSYATDLEKIAERNAVLSREIEDAHINLNENSEQFTHELKKVSAQIEKEIQEFNEKAEEYQERAKGIANEIYTRLQKFGEWKENFFNEVKEQLYTILAIATILLVFGYIITFGFSLNFGIIPLIITIGGILALTFSALGNMHKNIENENARIKNITFRAAVAFGKFIASKFGITADQTNVNAAHQAILNEGRKIVSTTRPYLAGVNEYYAGKNRQHRLNTFIQSIRNSLENFGINPDTKTEEYLNVFSSLKDEEAEWLEEISEKLSQFLNIPREIISLAYYEYTNNSEGKRNKWTEILKDKNVLKKLATILSQPDVIQIEYFDIEKARNLGAIEEILQEIDQFSLSTFRAVFYAFYVELSRYKRELLSALIENEIRVSPLIQTDLLKFVPTTKRQEDWVNELLEKTADSLHINNDVLELIFWDKLGIIERKRKAWENIVNSETKGEFFRLLIDHRLLQIPDQYLNSNQITTFVAEVLKYQSDYNILRFTRATSEFFAQLDTFKKQLLQALSNYSCYLSESERGEFQSLLHECPNGDKAIYVFLGQKFHTNSNVLRLLYLDYIQNKVERRSLYYNLKETGKIDALASFLIQRKKIEINDLEEDAQSNLMAILKLLDDFDLSELKSLYERYTTLLDYSFLITNFLHAENAIAEKPMINFETLHNIVVQEVNTPIYNQIKQIFDHVMLQESKEPWAEINDNRAAFTLAAAALLLTRRSDFNARIACQEASSVDTAAKILYQYVNLTAEKGMGSPLSLNEIAANVIAEEYVDYKLLSEFTAELSHGFLYPSLHDLLSARILGIQEQYEKKQNC